jgi:hypothetical protein
MMLLRFIISIGGGQYLFDGKVTDLDRARMYRSYEQALGDCIDARAKHPGTRVYWLNTDTGKSGEVGFDKWGRR